MVSFSTCDRSLSPVQPQPPHVPPCPQAIISLFPCLCSPSPSHHTLIGPQLTVLTAFQLKKCHPLHLPLLQSNRVYCHCCSPTHPHPFRPPRFSSKPASPSCCPPLPSPLLLSAPSQTPALTVLQSAGLTTKCELQGKGHSLATTDGDSGDSGLLQVVQLHFLGQKGWKKEDSSSARGVTNHEGTLSLSLREL